MTQEISNIPAIDTASALALLAKPEPLSPDEFDEIDAILDELRTRYDETPQWEFCEGFMAALICSRRPIESRRCTHSCSCPSTTPRACSSSDCGPIRGCASGHSGCRRAGKYTAANGGQR